MLYLHLRWEQAELVFYDPDPGPRIAILEDERARADSEHAARVAALTQLQAEREARAADRVRIRELEARVYNTDL